MGVKDIYDFFWSLYRLFRGFPEVEIPLFDRILGVLVAAELIGVALYTGTRALLAM